VTVVAVALVEDHTLFRAGMRALLATEDDVDIVAEASSLAELATIVAHPEVVVTDLVLTDGRGSAVVEAVQRQFPAARLLVLSMISDPDTVQAALGAGAAGYLLKDAASTELLAAIHAVASGGDYLQPTLGAAVARRRSGPDTELTQRERDIVRLIALGHTNAEIAELLHYSLRTIEADRTAASHKVGARSRAELVRFALEQGIIGPG
jgi:two-component system, NarL family, response regulator NreC